MSSFWTWQHAVVALSILAPCALLFHLSHSGLSQYRWVRALLILNVIQAIFPLLVDFRTNTYARFYFVISPISWICFYLVLAELVGFILADYRGISGAVRRLYGYALLVAVVISAMLNLPGLKIPTEQEFLLTFIAVQRFAIFSLFLLLALTLAILFYFQVPLSSNRKRYAIGYSLYFGVGVVADLLVSQWGLKSSENLGLWLVAISSFILLAGVFVLRKDGERQIAQITYSEREGFYRDKLNRQLSELNRVLSRAARAR